MVLAVQVLFTSEFSEITDLHNCMRACAQVEASLLKEVSNIKGVGKGSLALVRLPCMLACKPLALVTLHARAFSLVVRQGRGVSLRTGVGGV